MASAKPRLVKPLPDEQLIDLDELERETADFLFTYKGRQARVVYRPHAITPAFEAALGAEIARGSAADVNRLIEQVLALVVDWEFYVSDPEQPERRIKLPLTREALSRRSYLFLGELLRQIGEHLRPGPLPEPDSDATWSE